MKKIFLPVMLLLFIGCTSKTEKPLLRQGAYYTEEQGLAELKKMENMFSNAAQWEARKKLLRKNILKGLDLSPMPEKTPLNPVFGSKRIYDGYSVENVYFESIPGFYVFGNLYRPLDGSGKHPGILCPHGHFEGDTLGAWGRFHPDMQKRCATFARMGSVVFSYSMYGWGGESARQIDPSAIIEKPDPERIARLHSVPLALTMQTWNSIRALDFLETLPEVDMAKIAVTGASGGGTQTFLLSAIDDRVSVSIPVVMVSCHFFGGCNCESGLPIHQSNKHLTNNAEIAAMIAPKPLLMISDGADWTKNEPEVELPFIKRIFEFYQKGDNVMNVHFPDGVHDYSFEKRLPVYYFLAKHLGLDINSVTAADSTIDESKSITEKATDLLSFTSNKPFPSEALIGSEAIEAAFKKLK
ncbi:MAG: acetylxylan esterase [Bacteroidia bacterium]|nr:acetylxylan esterase [Bacteroidia bacterium]